MRTSNGIKLSKLLVTLTLGFSIESYSALPAAIKCETGETLVDHYIENNGRQVKIRESAQYVEFLGKGRIGGKVYRAQPWKIFETFVLKIYFEIQTFREDAIILQSFRRHTENHRAVTFKIPEIALREKDRTMIIENIDGVELHQYLMDPITPAKKKAYALELYDQRARKLLEIAERRSGLKEIETFPQEHVPYYFKLNEDGSSNLDGSTVYEGRLPSHGRKSIQVIIKTDNIIINPRTFEMTLIDPS